MILTFEVIKSERCCICQVCSYSLFDTMNAEKNIFEKSLVLCPEEAELRFDYGFFFVFGRVEG